MSTTPKLDRALADAVASAAKQPKQGAPEHIIVALLRSVKADPVRAEELERTVFAKDMPSDISAKADNQSLQAVCGLGQNEQHNQRDR